MNLPLPVADAATTAEVRDWLDRFGACVRDVDYAAALPFWHAEPRPVNLYRRFERELTMHGSRLYAREDWEEAIRLADGGAVPVAPPRLQ